MKWSSDRKIQIRSNAAKQRAANLLSLAQSNFRDQFYSLSPAERENLVYQTAINMGPPKLVKVNLPRDPKTGIEVSYDVMPNYFTIDNMVVPMTPATAEKIGDKFGLSLPTSKMSKQIWQMSDVKMQPLPQAINEQSWSDSVKKFNDSYAQQLANKKIRPNQIIGGGMKDLVIPEGNSQYVHATGWYNPTTGEALQKFVQTKHPSSYTDYSHGTRLVGNFTFKKGNETVGPLTMKELMSNPKYKEYARLISDKPETYSSYVNPQSAQSNKTNGYQNLIDNLSKEFL